MKKIALVLAVGLFCSSSAHSQNKVFAFFEYDIKDGMTDQFINGYAKDLEWHESQNDSWSWIGWFIANGERRGRFVDATPNHNWEEFDNWKVNGAENTRHNKIHWLPYVENPSGSYKVIMEEFSRYDQSWVTSKFLQVYHLKTKVTQYQDFITFLNEFKATLNTNLGKETPYIWMKTVSGGDIHEYDLFIAIDKVESLKQCEKLFSFSEKQDRITEHYYKSVINNTAEIWRYSDELTLKSN